MTPEHRALYGAQTKAMRRLTGFIKGNTTAPERVAEAVGKALTADRPKARYVVGADAYLQLAQRTLLPIRAHDALLAAATGARRGRRPR